MDLTITERPALRLATLASAPHGSLAEAFARLGEIAGAARLLGPPEPTFVTLFDRVAALPEAALVVPATTTLPGTLVERWRPAGRYVCTLHDGSYERLEAIWIRLLDRWLPASGETLGPGGRFVIYRTDPLAEPRDDLRSELYLSIV